MSDETTTTAAAADSSSGASEPPKRELEQAPLLLRKASTILIIGALFPWMTSIATQGHMPWGPWVGGVVLTLLAGFVLREGTNARAGAKTNGLVKAVAGMHPMAVTGLSLLLFVVAMGLAFSANVYFAKNTGEFLGFTLAEGTDGFADRYSFPAVMEICTLYLALATFAHIHAYEFGGKFNPIFPLMFMGPAIAGSLHVLKAAATVGDFGLALLGTLGSIIVAAGGIMAMYTMYVTMKVAKVEGDLKKAADRERRRSERSARKSS